MDYHSIGAGSCIWKGCKQLFLSRVLRSVSLGFLHLQGLSLSQWCYSPMWKKALPFGPPSECFGGLWVSSLLLGVYLLLMFSWGLQWGEVPLESDGLTTSKWDREEWDGESLLWGEDEFRLRIPAYHGDFNNININFSNSWAWDIFPFFFLSSLISFSNVLLCKVYRS